MNLFKSGTFKLHSGEQSNYIIDCKVFSDQDWYTLAQISVDKLPPFGIVEGVPTGGLKFAEKLRNHATCETCGHSYYPHSGHTITQASCYDCKLFKPINKLLIADDVFTTGQSMVEQLGNRDGIGIVVFARRKPPSWITPIFQM